MGTDKLIREVALPALQEDGTWGVSRHGNLVLVRFVGSLRAEHGQASAQRAIQLGGTDAVHLIGDLSELASYESGARVAWQEAWLPRRSQVRSIHVATGNRLVAMGVSAFALFLGMSLKSYSSSTELRRAAARLPRAAGAPPRR